MSNGKAPLRMWGHLKSKERVDLASGINPMAMATSRHLALGDPLMIVTWLIPSMLALDVKIDSRASIVQRAGDDLKGTDIRSLEIHSMLMMRQLLMSMSESVRKAHPRRLANWAKVQTHATQDPKRHHHKIDFTCQVQPLHLLEYWNLSWHLQASIKSQLNRETEA